MRDRKPIGGGKPVPNDEQPYATEGPEWQVPPSSDRPADSQTVGAQGPSGVGGPVGQAPDGEHSASPVDPSSQNAQGGRNLGLIAVVGVMVLVGIIAVAAIVLTGGSSKKHITGVDLLNSAGDVSGSLPDCHGTGGYDDFSAGTNVAITNDKGDIIGAAQLQEATDAEDLARHIVKAENITLVKAESDIKSLSDSGAVCILVFDVDVKAADFYQITIGHRGTLTFSKQEMEKKHWAVEATLGDG